MIWKGFRFGMFLQIAVGPICLFIFQTAATSDFMAAETGVLGVVVIDGLYILAAIFGLGRILNRYPKMKGFICYFGAAVLMLFGLSNIVSGIGVSLLPTFDFHANQTNEMVFIKTLVLTLSNPLTILFWAGVLSTKLVEENLQQHDMYLFGFGAVLSTFLFLTFISFIGTFLFLFLEPVVLIGFNIIVGIVLVGFGFRTATKQKAW